MEAKKLNLIEKKEAILNIIKKDGPCLPSALAGKVSLSLLLASALLSEIRAEKRLKVSSLKIGGSPLYYVEGQEAQLEKFAKNLPKKEQEAFELLKKKEVVNEERLEPAHRVALRSIRDFAFPIHVKIGNSEKIFWRLHSIKPEDASKKISEILKPKPEAKSKPKEEPKPKSESKPEKKDVKQEQKTEQKQEQKTEIKEKLKSKRRPKKNKENKEQFKTKVFDWIGLKNLHIEEAFEELKYGDDAFCIISTNSTLGKLNFLVVAKDKKRINDADLSLIYQQGQQARMPVLLLTKAKLTKKAQAYLEKLGKFVVVNSL